MKKMVNNANRFTDDLFASQKLDYEKYLKPYKGKNLKDMTSILNIAKALYHAGRASDVLRKRRVISGGMLKLR